MTFGLFEDMAPCRAQREELCPGAVVLRSFARVNEDAVCEALWFITAEAPLRHMITPGGFRMSVAMTNCGSYGWVTDRTGYRYDQIDPESGKPWPRMPSAFFNLAQDAAVSAGFKDFEPDACLVNRYEAGARLSLHQDKDERDFSAPIVSVSLGLPAIFLWGGLRREDKAMRIPLMHGDVMVWGGPARLRYHGVLPVKEGYHPRTGPYRINLTFRKAR
ncbi:DNA oxidative demethylase AlkB [Nitrosovibrio tenuis]|uniref:Alkylated DNA repair protein (DNA oxidative demethylase) n=1 Tax=Nitrosovibrio tenuis TaxID=1233 RepID=A0A1H7NIJ2_9PROT|nr:DNA oxidative demethylase AlkB [Nitrosovibrio tenuis]SEL22727.1 alkylated DNA repair protein (DNA oxidative demethylase) [Nitrosovibrio tenuis]